MQLQLQKRMLLELNVASTSHTLNVRRFRRARYWEDCDVCVFLGTQLLPKARWTSRSARQAAARFCISAMSTPAVYPSLQSQDAAMLWLRNRAPSWAAVRNQTLECSRWRQGQHGPLARGQLSFYCTTSAHACSVSPGSSSAGWRTTLKRFPAPTPHLPLR